MTVATLYSSQANAQLGVQKVTKKILPTVTVGLKVGANVQQMTGSVNPTLAWDGKYKPGILGGAFVSVNKKKAGVRVEGLIKTAKFGYSNGAYLKTACIDVPALFEFKLVPRVWIQIGPQFTSVISAKSDKSVDMKNTLRNADLSAVAGVEVTLPVKLVAGARYIKGFIDVNNTNAGGTWNNTSMQVYIGYRFIN